MTNQNDSKMIDVSGQDFDTAWNRIFPYTFHKLPLAAVAETDSENGIERAYQPLENSCGIFRSDGLELKTVGSEFEVVQPDEIKETFRPLIESGRVKLARGSGFRNGACLIAYGEIDTAIAEIVPKDFAKAEFNMYSGFDGTMSIGGGLTIKQMRCSNTLPIAIRASVQNTLNALRQTIGYPGFKFKHTKNVRVRLENAEQQIDQAVQAFQQTIETFRAIAAKKVNDQQLRAYVRKVFETAEPIAAGEERSSRFETRTNRIIELLETQRGYDLVPAMRGTLWQGYSAVTEYLTHEAGRSEDTRLNSNLFGTNARVSRLALDLALAQ